MLALAEEARQDGSVALTVHGTVDDETVEEFERGLDSALGVQPFCTPRRAALSPDGKTLAIGPDFPEGFRTEDGDLPVRLWDVATRQQTEQLQGHGSEVLSVAFSADGQTLASGSVLVSLTFTTSWSSGGAPADSLCSG